MLWQRLLFGAVMILFVVGLMYVDGWAASRAVNRLGEAAGLAFGLPLIATTCGGFPELVTDGKNGMLVEPEDADGIAAGLKKLAADPGMRESLGEAGKEMVLGEFAPDGKAAELETYLDNLLEG